MERHGATRYRPQRARRTRQGSRIARDAVIGAIAGTAATLAMTVAADALFRRLPSPDRYPLPPRELTEAAAAAVHLEQAFDEDGLQAATLASHFGFGAAAGALFGAVAGSRRAAPLGLRGIGYALGVWSASYFGWVPALGLLRPAGSHPSRRNALMLSVHLVWGSTLELTTARLAGALPPLAGGTLRDR